MFTQQAPTKYEKLDEVIDEILTRLKSEDPETGDYANMVDQLVKLYKVKETDSKIKVSEFEAIGKQHEMSFRLDLAKNDASHKYAEVEATARLKSEELNLKEREIDSSCQLKAAETDAKINETADRRRISNDTLAIIGANLAGIAIILGYERINIITSKAFGLVSKLR